MGFGFTVIVCTMVSVQPNAFVTTSSTSNVPAVPYAWNGFGPAPNAVPSPKSHCQATALVELSMNSDREFRQTTVKVKSATGSGNTCTVELKVSTQAKAFS